MYEVEMNYTKVLYTKELNTDLGNSRSLKRSALKEQGMKSEHTLYCLFTANNERVIFKSLSLPIVKHHTSKGRL